MRIEKFSILIFITIVGLCSCHRTRPQSPSNKHKSTDSESVALLLLNQRMAESADTELASFVKKTQLPFVWHESNIWTYCKQAEQQSKTDLFKTGDKVWVDWQSYSLDSVKIEDNSCEIEVGKAPLQAIDMALSCMTEGQHLTAVAPWYLCYGSTGANRVGPYKNIRIEITTKNKR